MSVVMPVFRDWSWPRIVSLVVVVMSLVNTLIVVVSCLILMTEAECGAPSA